MEENVVNYYGEMMIKDIIVGVWKDFGLVVMAAIICFCTTYIYMDIHYVPVYESTATMYIMGRQSGGTVTASDLSSAELLKTDVQNLIPSKLVLDEVIANLGLDVIYSDLNEMISITSPSGTRFIYITVRNENPAVAQKLSKEIVTVARRYILENMAIANVNIIEQGQYPVEMIDTEISNNVIMNTIYGAVVAMAVLVVSVLLDDSVKKAEDIQRNYGIDVLGVIPNRKL